MKKLECLVVGTGRCGTAYMAQLLTSAGIPCGHESIFSNKGIIEIKNKLKNPDAIELSECSLMTENPWVDPKEIIADSSYLAAPYLKSNFLSNTKIIHVVRHPIDVISSFVLDGLYFESFIPEKSEPYQNFIKKHIPAVYNNNFDAINRAAIYYISWNKLIERNIKFYKNYFFHNIESNPSKLIKFLGKKQYDRSINKKINTWKKEQRSISLRKLHPKVLANLKEISLRYNYHLVKI